MSGLVKLMSLAVVVGGGGGLVCVNALAAGDSTYAAYCRSMGSDAVNVSTPMIKKAKKGEIPVEVQKLVGNVAKIYGSDSVTQGDLKVKKGGGETSQSFFFFNSRTQYSFRIECVWNLAVDYN
jgi:hypothetical protein